MWYFNALLHNTGLRVDAFSHATPLEYMDQDRSIGDAIFDVQEYIKAIYVHQKVERIEGYRAMMLKLWRMFLGFVEFYDLDLEVIGNMNIEKLLKRHAKGLPVHTDAIMKLAIKKLHDILFPFGIQGEYKIHNDFHLFVVSRPVMREPLLRVPSHIANMLPNPNIVLDDKCLVHPSFHFDFQMPIVAYPNPLSPDMITGMIYGKLAAAGVIR